jgi:hypothetical protein
MGSALAATIAMYRSKESIFGSASWMITGDDRQAMPGVQPKDHPNRKEQAFLLRVTPEGDQMATVPIIRKDGKVSLGEWVMKIEGEKMGGLFGNLMHSGMSLGQSFDDRMLQYIDYHITEHTEEKNVMAPLCRVFSRLQRGEISPGMLAEAQRMAEQMRVREGGGDVS